METLGLHFVSSSNKGLKIKDTEQTRREAMIKMLKQCIKENRFLLLLIVKNFDYPEKPLKYKHIRRISD